MNPRDLVDPALNRLLIAWGKWNRNRQPEKHFHVFCKSIESGYLPPAGNVYSSVEDVLQASCGPKQEWTIQDMSETEKAVLGLYRASQRHANCLRLEYYVYKSRPLSWKRKVLGVTEDNYAQLLKYSAIMLRRYLTNLQTPL